MVVERFPPDIGGSGVRYSEIAQRLSKRHVVDIFTLGRTEGNAPSGLFRVLRFPIADSSLLCASSVRRVVGLSGSTFLELLTRKYDVIDVDFWPIFPFFAARLARTEAPVIVSWNVAWPFSFNRLTSMGSKTLALAVSRMSSHNITTSKFAKRNLSQELGLDEGRIDVIPNGVGYPFLKTHVESKPGRMIFVGRLEPQKRLDLVVAAFELVKRKFPETELHIVGSGPLRTRLVDCSAKTKGLYVHEAIPPDKNSDLAAELGKSWVFVSASEFETFGIAIAEALSVGLPVVTTRARYNAAADELVVDGFNGLVADHENPRAISDAIEKIFTQEGLWKKLSYNAKHGKPIPSWDDVAVMTETVYLRVLENSCNPRPISGNV
jgi:glycosyltransferase involved in cell wall biosynthesis